MRTPSPATTWAFLSFAVLALALLAWTATFGRFTSYDDIAFKSPGRELAATGRLAAPELAWFVVPLTISPAEIYGLQMPVYPIVFAGWSKVFGFGWREAFLFDAVVHVLFATSLAAFVTALNGRPSSIAPNAASSWVVAACLVPLGLATSGRPDVLAMAVCLTSQTLILAGPHSIARGAAAGVLATLAAFTSPIVFLCCMLAFTGFAIASAKRCRDTRLSLFVGVPIASILGVAVLIMIRVLWPDAISQFLEHSKSVRGHRALAYSLWDQWTFYRWIVIGPLLAIMCLLIVFGVAIFRRTWSGHSGAFTLSTIAAFLLALFGFHSPYYLWFAIPYVIAAVYILIRDLGASGLRSVRHVPAVVTLAVVGVSVAFDLWRYCLLLRGGTPQSWAYNSRLLQTLIPGSAVVLADEHWFSLAANRAVLDANFSRAEAMSTVTHVVLTGNGSGVPHQRKRLVPSVETVLDREFVVLYRGLNSPGVTLFGRPIGNSTYGMGFELLHRKPQATDATAPQGTLSGQ